MRTADSVHIMLFKVRPRSPCVERSLHLCNVDFIGADVYVIDTDVDVDANVDVDVDVDADVYVTVVDIDADCR